MADLIIVLYNLNLIGCLGGVLVVVGSLWLLLVGRFGWCVLFASFWFGIWYLL